ncbi:MAG: MBL fold metallo-hydrolase, partial [Acidobacteriota bacterium]
MNQKSTTPKDAATIILIKSDSNEVLWARRNPNLKFLGGYHAFAGGKVDAIDAEIEVKNCEDKEKAKFIVCAAREVFEEIGVLLVRNGEKLTKGQRASLHDDLISGRMNFSEVLTHWNLWLDGEDFTYTGFWTTPPFSPMRFKTRFFLAVCPTKQEPYAAISEMENIEFIRPDEALNHWKKSEVLISPPVLLVLKELSANFQISGEMNSETLKICAEKLLEKSQECDGQINYIELNSRLICFPLKTETLPPATHTNCFIVGGQEFVVIDAASRDEAEQNKLFELIDSFIEKDFVCKELIISHLHKDHFGGETVLQKHLLEKFGSQVPISAHRLTAESLRNEVKIEKFIEDDEDINLKDENGEMFALKALHTPGHARGHLCFYDEDFGFLLSSDNVIGSGSVLIAPPEGNMKDYLASLEKMKNLPNLRLLCGSHGAAMVDAKSKIENYIAHRLERERKI